MTAAWRDRDGRLVLAGTVVLLASLPMRWYRTDVPRFAFEARGWAGPGVGWTLLAVAAALGASALVVGDAAGSPTVRRIVDRAPWLDGALGLVVVGALSARLVLDGRFHSYGLRVALVAGTVVAFGAVAASLRRRRTAAAASAPERPPGVAAQDGSTQPAAPPPGPAGASRG